MLWNRSLVMYDVETKTHWSHIRGEAMEGELKGTHLEMLPSEMTTWEGWRLRHPSTSLLNLSRTHKAFTRDFYKEPGAFVYGWAAGRTRRHVGMDALASRPVRNLETGGEPLLVTFDAASTAAQMFSREIEGRLLRFTAAGERRMRDEQTGSEWDLVSGEALEGPLRGKRLERRLGMLSYRKAWMDFYPASQETEP